MRKRKILLFSHDPGGSNTIIPLVKPLQKRGYDTLLYGKEISIKKYTEFGLKGKNISRKIKKISVASLTKLLFTISPNFVITGTSGEDMTERYLWKAAEITKIPSFAILDSWMNYGIRFSKYKVSQISKYNKYKTHTYLPNKICVMDKLAKQEAIKEGLNKDKILITGQPYFQLLLDKKHMVIKNSRLRRLLNISPSEKIIIFISEPISQFYKPDKGLKPYWGYTEKTIFKSIYKTLGKISLKRKLNITLLIKLHPRENLHNYDLLLNNLPSYQKLKVKILPHNNISNWDLLLGANLIIGMSSMLLIEALLLGQPIVSVQIGLKKANPFVLAKKGIIGCITDQKKLYSAIYNILANYQKPKYNVEIIKRPIEKVICEMEKII